MERKYRNILNKFIDIVSPFIGFQYNEELNEILDNILKFVCKINDVPIEQYEIMKKTINTLFSINKYSEYRLLSKGNYLDNNEVFNLFPKYFEYLEKIDNKTQCLDVDEFKGKLNDCALLGDLQSLKLKAILCYLGVICSKSEQTAIKLFKECAVYGDTFYYKILSRVDIEREDYYIDLLKCLNYCSENLIVNFKDLDYSNNVKNECEIYFKLKNKYNKERKVDHKLFDYLINSKDKHSEKFKNIDKGLFDEKEFQTIKFGF